MADNLTEEHFRKRYHARLCAELEAIKTAGDETTEDRKPVVLDQQSVGRLSRMDALQGQAMAQAMQARRNGRTRAIAAALDRLSGDEFGWCEYCGDYIGTRRLDLDPTILRCVDCAR